ncbi:hypothetical protein EVAR_16158_1 [Eumeta japonica]|uniref:Uncharacterized protein n=1 Tax=Eumeta variegata TaxID=151549 RepID=A0A4C1WDE1_EUMVA|nr:hypothetical protein EVAR_16158_1 [Eumeta japonica]
MECPLEYKKQWQSHAVADLPQHENSSARHTLTKYSSEVATFGVVFRTESESSGGPLTSNRYPIPYQKASNALVVGVYGQRGGTKMGRRDRRYTTLVQNEVATSTVIRPVTESSGGPLSPIIPLSFHQIFYILMTPLGLQGSMSGDDYVLSGSA